jgi:D-alanyl-lipoteichoic acid acyltransferase DltB (MBOAT superfamily)
MFFYSVQIYADFSGYSDMAIGVGKLLGFNIMKNFNYPYFSRNISEFWRRWHISLTSWFTDYVYIPLGGNRCGKYRTMLNSLIVFTICGLWHGADWSFVLWGFMNGALFIPYLMQRNPRKYKNEPLSFSVSTVAKMLFMFFVASVCWVFFRADNISSAFSFFGHMFDSSILTIPRFTGMTNISFLIMVPYLVFLLIVEWVGRDKECPLFMKTPYGWWQFVSYAFIVASIYFLGTDSSSFIYFNF